MSIVTPGLVYWPNPLVGKPLFNGSVYVGEPDLDPSIEANQKQVSLKLEDGTFVEVGQPLKLSPGGVMEYNGSYAVITADGNYSVAAYAKNGTLAFYIPSNTGLFDASDVDYNSTTVGEYLDSIMVDDYAELRGIDSSVLPDGVHIQVAGFPDSWEKKTGAASASIVDNGWCVIASDDPDVYYESTSSFMPYEIFQAAGTNNEAWAAMILQSRTTRLAIRAPVTDTIITEGATADHFFVLYGLRECGSLRWQPESDDDILLDVTYSSSTTPQWSKSTEGTLMGPIIRDMYIRGDRNRAMGGLKFTQCDKNFIENIRITGIKGHSIEIDSCREWTLDSVITRFNGDRSTAKADISLHSDLPPTENTNFSHIRGCFFIYSLWDLLEIDDCDAMSISGGLMLHNMPLDGQSSLEIFYGDYYGNTTDVDDWYDTFYDAGGADESSLLQLSSSSTVQADHIKFYAGGAVPINISEGRFVCSNALMNGSDRTNGADFCLRATDSAKVQIQSAFCNNTQEIFEEVSSAEVSIGNIIEGSSIGSTQTQSGALSNISYGAHTFRASELRFEVETEGGTRRNMRTTTSGNNWRFVNSQGAVTTVGLEPFNTDYEERDIWYQSGAIRAQTDNGTKYFGLKTSVPVSASSSGRIGDWAVDSSYIYVYTGDGTTHSWVRSSASTW